MNETPPNNNKKRPRFWIILFLVSFIIFFVLLFALRMTIDLPNLFRSGESVQKTSDNATGSDPQPQAGIPGLDPASTQDYLVAKNYECSEKSIGENDLIHWVCWQESQ